MLVDGGCSLQGRTDDDEAQKDAATAADPCFVGFGARQSKFVVL